MNFHQAIEVYIRDQRSAGRINSDRTEASYRSALELHAADVGNRDPRTVGREECKLTLARWPHPNTQLGRRAVLVSFYDWAVEEGMRPSNPARQTRRPRRRPATTYRLTRGEVISMMRACETTQEIRAIHIGLCAGLRSAELRGLTGKHFGRDGFVWVSASIAKGGRERWVPVVEELVPIVENIRETVADDHYVLTAMRCMDPPFNTTWRSIPTKPMAPKPLWELVKRIGERAGVNHPTHPHLLRHAFGDHIARHGGIELARAMLGHADVRTTKRMWVTRRWTSSR